MSSSCPNRRAASAIAFRRLPADRLRPLEPEQLSARIPRLHHAVRQQRQPSAPAAALYVCLRILPRPPNSQRQPRLQQHFFPIAIRRQMPGIRHRHLALRRQIRAQRQVTNPSSCVSTNLPVQPRQHCRRTQASPAASVRSAPSASVLVIAAFNPLPLTSPTTTSATRPPRQHLIEISAHLLRRKIRRLHRLSRHLRQRRRHQPPLDLPRRLQLRRRRACSRLTRVNRKNITTPIASRNRKSPRSASCNGTGPS